MSLGRAGSSGDPVPEGHSPHHTKRGTQPGQCFVQTPAEIPQGWSPRHEGHALSQVRELINKVRAVFVETLEELGWMDEASKKKAREKVGGRLECHSQGLPPGEGGPRVGAWGDCQSSHPH